MTGHFGKRTARNACTEFVAAVYKIHKHTRRIAKTYIHRIIQGPILIHYKPTPLAEIADRTYFIAMYSCNNDMLGMPIKSLINRIYCFS
jgi:hypothetical protein